MGRQGKHTLREIPGRAVPPSLLGGIMKKVLVVGGGEVYHRPFRQFGPYSHDLSLLFEKPEDISLVVFTGGADISPSLYNHTPSSLTFCTPKRDIYELVAFRHALKLKMPIAGICRGAQFLCAMAGGSLYQHVSGHDKSHMMETFDGRIINVTSTHHQMQNPPKDAVVLGWSHRPLSDIFVVAGDEEVPPPAKEYECVYYPNINAVGMQYHPEMMYEDAPGFKFAAELVKFVLPQ